MTTTSPDKVSGLRVFGSNIWLADGPSVTVAGFRYPTRMAIIRLPDDQLFVWSPIARSEILKDEIDGLGQVTHIVAPNSLHHIHLTAWQKTFPLARVYGAPDLNRRVPELKLDEIIADHTQMAWSDWIDHVVVPGNRITTEVVFYHADSRTVLFTDLIQQFDTGWFKGWRALVARMDLMIGQEPNVPRKFRLAFTDRKSARNALDRILAWPIEKVVMAHGRPVENNGQEVLKQTFRWLYA